MWVDCLASAGSLIDHLRSYSLSAQTRHRRAITSYYISRHHSRSPPLLSRAAFSREKRRACRRRSIKRDERPALIRGRTQNSAHYRVFFCASMRCASVQSTSKDAKIQRKTQYNRDFLLCVHVRHAGAGDWTRSEAHETSSRPGGSEVRAGGR